MGFEAIEYVCDLLALVGSKRGHINQSLDTFGTRQGYDRTGISVSRQTIGPSVRSRLRLSAATSSASEVSGSGAAITLIASAFSAVMTCAQLDPSAHAPCASTTLTSFIAMPLLPIARCRQLVTYLAATGR